MINHILFVERDLNIRQGLQRKLDSIRGEWDVAFVESAHDTREYTASYPVDVIVFDIRMPEMDRAHLLRSVSKPHPGMIPIDLSSYADNQGGTQESELSKPNDSDVLISAIKRSLSIQAHLRAPVLCEFVAGIKSLPTVLDAYNAFIEEVSKPSSTTTSVAATIEQDTALASAVLTLAGSDYFDSPENVIGIPQAIERLGLETISSLIAFTSLFAEFSGKSDHTEWVDHLGSRSASIGRLSRDIARLEGLADHDVDRACCAGMLLHIGTLVLISSHPEGYVRIGEMIEARGINIVEAERQEFSASHADVSAYLLGLWGFTDPVVEAVLLHHAPGTKTADTFSPASAVHVAQGLSRLIDGDTGTHFSDDELLAALDMDHLQHVGRSDRLPAWRKHIEDIIRKKGNS